MADRKAQKTDSRTETRADQPGQTQRTKGLAFERFFTRDGKDPLEAVAYVKRDSVISEPNGKIVFELRGAEVPEGWSQLATDIAASKYFRKAGVPGIGRESSARQLVHRVAHTIRAEGEKRGYFASADAANVFEAELKFILIHQRAAFNSPVWFNCGLFHEYGLTGSGGSWFWNEETNRVEETANAYEHPQLSACFIQKLDDDLMSIYELVKNEARLFKHGSGTGTNFSVLRSRYEKLSGGGTSSGLMSFLEVFDRAAGATKSGGTTRRAAKMVCVDMDHPEIVDFIEWKAKEEKKAKALIAMGYPADFNGDAYHTVSGQNSNNSVRIPDAFMDAFLSGGKWQTRARTTGEVVHEYDARELMHKIAESAWHCADPGVQFDTTMQDWHTVPNTGRINATNPCSEFVFLDDTACNLASINLVKFMNADGTFDVDAYRSAVRTLTTAMEIIVDFASYPTKGIAENSHAYRPLGLGYANLGTLLMLQGLPYDSPEGRAWAGALTAILTGHAYGTSAELAAVKGPFAGFEKNREPFLRVMNKHRDAAYKIDAKAAPAYLLRAAQEDWDRVLVLGEKNGFRNAQASVIAPTGTIGLLMDCDTTGIEPDFSIVKWKKLAGGGFFKIVNASVSRALQRLGYSDAQCQDILRYVLGAGTLDGAPHVNPASLRKLGFTDEQIKEAGDYVTMMKNLDDYTPHINPKALREKGMSDAQVQEAQVFVGGAQTVEGAPHLRAEHLPVFDCANKCGNGKRFLAPMAHVKMMAAVQPFISGAISKTVNLPADASIADIEEVYVQSWKLGVKALAVYRDGSKSSQPLNTKLEGEKTVVTERIVYKPLRRRLPDERQAIAHKFSVAGHEGYIHVGLYDDGAAGEIFITMNKEGSVISGVMDAFSTSVSLALQYGVPLKVLVSKFINMRFEPSGVTSNPDIRFAKSILDYLFRWLGRKFLPREDQEELGLVHADPVASPTAPGPANGLAQAPSLPAAPVTSKGTPVHVEKPVSLDPRVDESAIKFSAHFDAPACAECGSFMVPNGTCYKCTNCGATSGCS